MIAFVKGRFALKTPAQVIVDVNDVGYELQISLNTYSHISNKEEGLLYTYLYVTENAQILYGFFEVEEKELFLQLINVSGVGASTARMMLSGMKPGEIVKAIVQGNAKQLEGIKGIGKKTSERLVLELKDKLNKQWGVSAGNITDDGNILNAAGNIELDALQALVSLGIARQAAETAVRKVLRQQESIDLENLIKLSLKNL